MDQIQATRLFTTIAETGSFTQAADRLGIPRATASNAIMQTERQLGVKLLTRNTRSVKLTAEGQQYLAQCRLVLTHWDESQNLFSASQTKPQGTVCVDLPERMANMTVIPALPEFFARHPEVRLVVAGSSRFVDLINEEVDCVVRVGEMSDSALTARLIGHLDMVNVASPSYLAKFGTPIALAELEKHPVVGYISGKTKRQMDWECMIDSQVCSQKLPSQIVVSNTESYIAACLAGLGLIQSPLLSVEAHLRNGSLVEVLPQFKPPALPVYVVYAQRRLQAARVRVFVDWLAAYLGHKLLPIENT